MKKSVASMCRKFASEKLQSAQTAEAFENRVTTLLAENLTLSIDIDLPWDSISHCLRTAAEDIISTPIALNATGMTRNAERHFSL